MTADEHAADAGPAHAAEDRSARGFLSAPILGADFDLAGLLQAPHREATAEAPATIGNYRLREMLGSGRFGTVVVAEQTEPVRRRVALKLCHHGWDPAEAGGRFRREAHALTRFDHPGIARLLEVGVLHDGRMWYSMELVQGQPLTTCAETRQLGLRDRVALLVQLCSAVQHAHGKGVVHRDLKPSNVLVDWSSGAPVVKVIDFGIARILEADDGTCFRTAVGHVVGTPAYMSPEQFYGKAGDVDARCDIYAIGVIAHELIARRPLLDLAGLTSAQAVFRLRASARPRLGEVVPQAAGDLETIVGKAMAEAAEDRYQTAAELGAEFQRWLAGDTILARRPAAWERCCRAVRRRPLVAGLAGALVAALLCAVGLLARLVVHYRAEVHALESGVRNGLRAVASLAQVPGALPTMRGLLEAAERDSARLRERSPRDPSSIRLRAEVLERLADLERLDGNWSHVGDLRSEAFALRRSIVEDGAGDAGDVHAFAIATVTMGDWARENGELHDAAERYHAALCMHLDLSEAEPGDLEYQRQVTSGYMRLADVAHARTNVEEFRHWTELLWEHADLIAAIFVEEPGPLHDRVLARSYRSRLLHRPDDRERLLQLDSLEDIDRAHLLARHNREYQKVRCTILNALGYLDRERGELRSAVQWNDLARRAVDRLRDLDASNADLHGIDCSIRVEAAQLALAQGDSDKATREAALALVAASALAASRPETPEARMHLAAALDLLGEIANALRRSTGPAE